MVTQTTEVTSAPTVTVTTSATVTTTADTTAEKPYGALMAVFLALFLATLVLRSDPDIEDQKDLTRDHHKLPLFVQHRIPRDSCIETLMGGTFFVVRSRGIR